MYSAKKKKKKHMFSSLNLFNPLFCPNFIYHEKLNRKPLEDCICERKGCLKRDTSEKIIVIKQLERRSICESQI